MEQHSIDTFGTDWVSVKVKCNNCGEEFETETVGVPSPNYGAEKARDSYTENGETSNCPNCNKEFNVTVWSSFGGGYVDISTDDDELIEIIEHASEDYEKYIDSQIDTIIEDDNYFENFLSSIDEINQLAELRKNNNDLERIILMNAYSALVTQLETYLQNALISNVLTNDELFKSFVESFKNFKNEKFKISEIYQKQQELKSKAKFELSELIYHNLHKIKPIYQAVFGIEVPEIGELMKIVQIRHDLIHRAGKDKEGTFVNIGEEEFNKAKAEIVEFVTQINDEVKEVL